METGLRDSFHWIDARSDMGLGAIVEAVPRLAARKYVVISSFDSGPLVLSEEERQAGWFMIGDLACSPRNPTPASLPAEGYDEWYIFDDIPTPFEPRRFSSYSGFTIAPSAPHPAPDPTWDNAAERAYISGRVVSIDAFFAHLGEIRPITYLGDGDRLVIATTEIGVFDDCVEVLSRRKGPR